MDFGERILHKVIQSFPVRINNSCESYRKWLRAKMPKILWRGYPLLKTPGDIINYIELLHNEQFELIIEIGTLYGGSALMFADEGKCDVYSIDIHNRSNLPENPRIKYLIGDSVTIDLPNFKNHPCLVVLDGDHSKNHVYAELERYSRFADYIVVEDIDASESLANGPGPKEAVDTFLIGEDRWKIENKTKFGYTNNIWLRRV